MTKTLYSMNVINYVGEFFVCAPMLLQKQQFQLQLAKMEKQYNEYKNADDEYRVYKDEKTYDDDESIMIVYEYTFNNVTTQLIKRQCKNGFIFNKNWIKSSYEK